MPAPAVPRVTEVAFTKNEGRFLLEWIAYHRTIGVGDFLIYTNDCEDESPALLDRLAEMGIATHIPNPVQPGEQPQNRALNLAMDHPLVQSADYVLQIDPDEFLLVKTGEGRIADLIATAPEADIICIQMRFFGDSGLARLGDGLVVEQLTGASLESFEMNNIVKSLARVGGPFVKITANHMPGFEPKDGQHPRIFNCGGVEIAPEAYGGERFRAIPDAYRATANAQLNHYAVRTLADFRAKMHRGDAILNPTRFNRSYWERRNRNEDRDTAIQRFVPHVRALMAAWLADSELEKRNRRCFEAYRDIVRRAEGLL